MDKEQKASYIIERANSLVQTYYAVKEDQTDISKLIKQTNIFFNRIKTWKVEQGLLRFLYELSVFIGLPQYFDMFLRFSGNTCELGISNSTLTAGICESSLVVNKTEEGKYQKLHLYQKHVIDAFRQEAQNRFILTAPTSFGKTFVVPQIMQRMKYGNVALIFPTLALLSQNYLEISSNPLFSDFSIHTLSEFVPGGEKNIWIYTPERFLSMTDKSPALKFDFVFMDEVYKIDNQYLLQNAVGENERDVTYRIALNVACKRSKDILLAGPFIELPSKNKEYSINNFIKENEFSLLIYNNIEIVEKEIHSIIENGNYAFLDDMQFEITNKDLYKRLNKVLAKIKGNDENAIVYCGGRAETESVASKITEMKLFDIRECFKNEQIKNEYREFVNHLISNFSSKWIVVRGLMSSVGIHHGYIPKYIQKEIVRYFNEGVIKCLVTTTTITEGINTTAKNMIVLSDKKGKKPLKKFDAQNIAGRAGRFIHHYNGRVISINNKFKDILESESEILKHKNYDLETKKSEIDYEITPSKYLSNEDKLKKEEIEKRITELGIPRSIFYQYKSVSPAKKLIAFEAISKYSDAEFEIINESIKSLFIYKNINWASFDYFIEKLKVLFDESDWNLNRLVDHKTRKGYSALTVKVYNYFESGYKGLLSYSNGISTDINKNIRETSELVFNIFRYQLCKYIGVFDIFYRYILSQKQNVNIDEIVGFTMLLQMLEYGATSDIGKKISDYGVPFSVIEYIDTSNKKIKENFDDYEKRIYTEVSEKFKL